MFVLIYVRAMRVIFARCIVRYTGRIDAELELGDRLIVVKDDGAVLIHATSGLQPKNWMPAGSDLVEEPGLIRVEFPRRDERLEIYLIQVHSDSDHVGELSGRLVKLGSEREFSDLLAVHLGRVEENLTLVGREYRTRVGPVDLMTVDADGCPVVIEVKRARAVGVEVAYQLLRYLHAVGQEERWEGRPARGILVAPGLSRPLTAALAEHQLGFVRLSFEKLTEAT